MKLKNFNISIEKLREYEQNIENVLCIKIRFEFLVKIFSRGEEEVYYSCELNVSSWYYISSYKTGGGRLYENE